MWNFSELFYRNQGQENSGYVTVPGVDVGKAFAARGGASVERSLRQSDSGGLAKAGGREPYSDDPNDRGDHGSASDRNGLR
jgi:hypothetical protein